MLTTLRNAWKIADLRKKLLFTLLIILLYRIGNVIPVPFVNVQKMSQLFEQQLSNTILGLMNMMSGGAFSMATIFALGIQPAINASIIIQLLTIAIPALERLSKEGGEAGKKTLSKITRYTTVGLGVLMGFAYYMMLVNYNSQYGNQLLTQTGVLPAIVIILTFTAGATLVTWLGDQITEFGIGNGISMILFANIIARIPQGIFMPIYQELKLSFSSFWYWALLIVIAMLAVIVFIVFVSQAERLAAQLSIPTISTGNILREAIKNGTETGRKAKSLIEKGQLVPDDVILGIVRERLTQPDCANGYILDGVPRTIAQAQGLIDLGIEIDRVVSIEIADEVIEARMTGRRVCGSCGASYHLTANPPKTEGICNVCGGALVTRKDDEPETVRNRLRVYHAETEALKGFYENLGKLRLVNGDQAIEDATRDILAALGD